MTGRRLLTTLLTIAFLVGGCGQGSGAAGGDTCKGGATEPLTLKDVLQGLRAANYNVYVDPNCSLREASWGVTNFSDLVPELRGEDFEATRDREGAIACTIFPHDTGIGPKARTHKWEGDEFTTVDVLNVSCYIYPNPEIEAEHVARLVETLNRLAASAGNP